MTGLRSVIPARLGDKTDQEWARETWWQGRPVSELDRDELVTCLRHQVEIQRMETAPPWQMPPESDMVKAMREMQEKIIVEIRATSKLPQEMVHPRCAQCNGDGSVRYPGGSYGPCDACGGKGY